MTAARLQGDATGNLLTEALKKDRHVGRFVPRVLPDKSVEGIPSKDNGFDIEGLAVSGNRVFVGLRGPVLRGWSIILELRVKDASAGVLALESLGTAGEPYLKHLLPLDGLGVREHRDPGQRSAGARGSDDGSRRSGFHLPLEERPHAAERIRSPRRRIWPRWSSCLSV